MSTLAEILAKKKAESEALKTGAVDLVKLAAEKKAREAEFTRTHGRDFVAAARQQVAAQKKKLSLAELLALKKHEQESAAEALALAGTDESTLTGFEEEGETVSIPAEEALNGSSKFQEAPPVQDVSHLHDSKTFALDIVLNEKQLMAKEFAFSNKNFCLIGAAGTGKTTTQRAVAQSLLESGRLKQTTFKLQGLQRTVEAPSIAFCSYTRRATSNLARAIHRLPELEEKLKHNIMTIHALLEYQPVTYWDEVEQRECFRFEPQRTASRPLTITHLVIEEASMLGLDLWEKLFDALPLGVQIIFIGDINQLPPVFGSSILNYALVQLPVIELTEVYRQAEGSPVINNAHRILKGESVVEEENEQGAFQIIRGKSEVQVGQEKMSNMLGILFKQFWEQSIYDPETDIILSPWNKNPLGTDNMNKWIAQFLGAQRAAVVHEVIAGFNKLYLAVGDKVMCNKQDGVIEAISINGMYQGQAAQVAGTDLSRFGARIIGHGGAASLDDILLGYSSFSIEELADSDGGRVQQASHVVTVRMETGLTTTLRTAGDFSPQTFSLGYVLTVHKAQGCEWRKVFILLHKDHNMGGFLSRELLYTAVTRARESVVVIGKDYIIDKAIKTQRIKGNSLQDKIEYFNSGAVEQGIVQCTK